MWFMNKNRNINFFFSLQNDAPRFAEVDRCIVRLDESNLPLSFWERFRCYRDCLKKEKYLKQLIRNFFN